MAHSRNVQSEQKKKKKKNKHAKGERHDSPISDNVNGEEQKNLKLSKTGDVDSGKTSDGMKSKKRKNHSKEINSNSMPCEVQPKKTKEKRKKGEKEMISEEEAAPLVAESGGKSNSHSSKRKAVVQNENEPKKKKTKKKDKENTDASPSHDVIEKKADVQDDVAKEQKRKEKRKAKKAAKKLKKANTKPAAEAQTSSTEPPVAQTQSLEFLRRWKEDREHWSFQKVRQVWLLQHMYDTAKICDADFSVLLEYMDALKGKAREETVQKAEKLVANSEDHESDTEHSISPTQLERVRQVLQILG